MKKLLLFLFTSSLSFSQTPHVVFNKYYGGSGGGGSNEATCIIKTSDGGYIVGGSTQYPNEETLNHHGSFDAFVVKLNANFETVWSKCYGTTGAEYLRQIKQTSDGGYAFVGDNYNDYWVVRLDSSGEVLWTKTYGGTGQDKGASIDISPNGNLLVAGNSFSNNNDVNANFGYDDYWVIRLNSSNGDIISSKNFGGPRNDTGHAIIANSDGSYIVAGEAFSYTGQVSCRNAAYCESDIWVVKANESNDILWAKCFGSVMAGSNFFNIPYKIIATNDNGFLIVGRRDDYYNAYGQDDFWAIKIDANGTTQWSKNYGGSDDDVAFSVQQTLDGGYIITGESYSPTSSDVTVTLTGYSMQNGWVIKISSTGTLEWQKTLGSSMGGGYYGFDYFRDVVQINENEYAIVGKCGGTIGDTFDSNGRAFWLTKISTAELANDEFNATNFQIYPNPSSNILNLHAKETITEVAVTDMSGRKIFGVTSDDIKQLNISSLTKGVYLLTASNGMNSVSKKIIKD